LFCIFIIIIIIVISDVQKQTPQVMESYKAGLFIAALGARGSLLLTRTPRRTARTYLLWSLSE